MKSNWIKGALGVCSIVLLFSFLYCDHSPFGSDNPVSPEPTATPSSTATPQPTATPSSTVTPSGTPTPGPTPTPSPTPAPTPATLTGLWTGTYQDNNASGTVNCSIMTGPLALDIVQADTSLTIDVRSDNPILDPLLDAGQMIVNATLTDPTFSGNGEVLWGGNIRTTITVFNGTVSGNTITGNYISESCYTDLGTCFCFKSGTYTVSR